MGELAELRRALHDMKSMTVGMLALLRIAGDRAKEPMDDAGREEMLTEIRLMIRTCEQADRLVSSAYYTLQQNQATEIVNLSGVIETGYRNARKDGEPDLVIETDLFPWCDARNLAVLTEFCFAHTVGDATTHVRQVDERISITISPVSMVPNPTWSDLIQRLATLNSATLTLKPAHKTATIVIPMSRGIG